MPSNVCTCVYHVNINYLISAIHRYNTDFPKDHLQLLTATTCGGKEGLEAELCQFSECDNCSKVTI